jgi:hypothetical protein
MATTIDLLPRKSFEIHLEDGEVIAGQYGTWALSRFCDRIGVTLTDLSKRMEKGITMNDLLLFILCSVEYTCRKEKKSFAFNDLDAAQWVDALGGVGSEQVARLINHLMPSEETGQEDEKKSQTLPTSSDTLQPQELHRASSGS